MPVKPISADEYFQIGCGRCKNGGTPKCKVHFWNKELKSLRTIIVKSGLKEEIKWDAPCFTHENKNILMLSALKENVVVSFFQGSLMSDPHGVLEKPGENSQHARYMRFTDEKNIASLKRTLLAYIKEAVDIKNSGIKVSPNQAPKLEIPEELTQAFQADVKLKKAFNALTPGRQRSYLLHITAAKQSATRQSRIVKCAKKIFQGKGFNER